MAFYIGKMRGSVSDAAMGMDVAALFPYRCRLPAFQQTAFTDRSGYSRMDLGTMLQGAGSSAAAGHRAIAGILPAGFTVANCLLRPCASRTPPPPLCHPFIFFNGILEMVFFIRLSMALLIRLIMALFTRPKIGLFHPTLTPDDQERAGGASRVFLQGSK